MSLQELQDASSLVDPPYDAYKADGWDMYEFAIGYFATVSLLSSNSMRIAFSSQETGPTSGLFAKDARILYLAYEVYIPSASMLQGNGFRLPGAVDTVSIQTHLRAPGWNSIRVYKSDLALGVRVNTIDIDISAIRGTIDPTDLSSYLYTQQQAAYILLDTVTRTTVFDQGFETPLFQPTRDPSQPGFLIIVPLDNETLQFKYRGTDGVVRSATLTLT